MYDGEVENSRILINLLQKQLGDFKSKYPIEWQNILIEYPKLKIYDNIEKNNLCFAIVNDSFAILSIGLTLENITWFECRYRCEFKKGTKLHYQCHYQPHGHPNYTSSDLKLCSEIIPKLFPRFTMDPYCTWIEIETK